MNRLESPVPDEIEIGLSSFLWSLLAAWRKAENRRNEGKISASVAPCKTMQTIVESAQMKPAINLYYHTCTSQSSKTSD